jgi:hypothetical protein
MLGNVSINRIAASARQEGLEAAFKVRHATSRTIPQQCIHGIGLGMGED